MEHWLRLMGCFILYSTSLIKWSHVSNSGDFNKNASRLSYYWKECRKHHKSQKTPKGVKNAVWNSPEISLKYNRNPLFVYESKQWVGQNFSHCPSMSTGKEEYKYLSCHKWQMLLMWLKIYYCRA